MAIYPNTIHRHEAGTPDKPNTTLEVNEKAASHPKRIPVGSDTSDRRSRRLQEMKRQKARQMMLRKYLKIALPCLAGLLVIVVLAVVLPGSSEEPDAAGSVGGQEIVTIHGNAGGQGGSGTQGNAEGSNVAGGQNGSAGDNSAAGAGNSGDQNAANGQDSSAEKNDTNRTDDTGDQSAASGQDNSAGENHSTDQGSNPEDNSSAGQNSTTANNTEIPSAHTTENTLRLTDEIVSTNALFIDLESDTILGQKSMDTVISPASMTKVLTILVAAEQIEESQLDDTFTMTLEITDYGYINDCSSAGFLDGEEITVRDLFYGTILPSGADAAVGLAVYVAGSQEAFVELMNEKIDDLGLSDTAHMTNCVGIYDKEHHCTVYDMAMIMEAAIENDLCREVMTAHTYTTSATTQHPEGILLSNWFLRRIEDKDTGGEVLCAKTGFVAQSGSCAVSYGTDHAGKEYICVTANASSSWKCIYDHVALYKKFATDN